MTHATRRRSTLLFVCHANICRSPLAELLTRSALAEQPNLTHSRIEVTSAGTHAQDGKEIHPGAARALQELEVNGSHEFRSRALSAKRVAGASVILAATRQERAICATLSPTSIKRLFTIRQFGRLVSVLDPGCLSAVHPSRRLETLVDKVLVARDQVQPVPPEYDDLADPVHGTEQDMQICVQQIQQALQPVLTLLTA